MALIIGYYLEYVLLFLRLSCYSVYYLVVLDVFLLFEIISICYFSLFGYILALLDIVQCFCILSCRNSSFSLFFPA